MLIRLLLLSAISLAACGGKQDQPVTAPVAAAADQDDGATAETPAGEPSANGAGAENVTEAEAPPPSGPASPASAVVKDMVAIVREMADVTNAAGEDCDAMANGLDQVIDANETKLEAIKKLSDEMKARIKADPEAAEAVMKELAPILSEVVDAGVRLAKGMMRCAENDKMKAVQAKWQKYQ